VDVPGRPDESDQDGCTDGVRLGVMTTESADRAFAGNDMSAARWFAEQPAWWEDHYAGAVDQAVEFLSGDGISLAGSRVLDLGCGDGIISLGLLRRGGAAEVTGIDLVDVDLPFLQRVATAHGEPALREDERLRFRRSEPDMVPLPDESVDIVTAWSVFEHVSEPAKLLADVKRVLRPGGVLFIQIWPMFNSEHGSHLWPWFDVPFQHHVLDDAQMREHLRGRIGDAQLAEAMYDLYKSCNGATVDDLQAALVDAGLYLAKVELQSNAFHVPPELQRVPISKLGISGVKLLAVRQ
jgi:SAM-dependent methyltransferase